MSEKDRWSAGDVVVEVVCVVCVAEVVVVESLSRERDRARGVRCVIRRC